MKDDLTDKCPDCGMEYVSPGHKCKKTEDTGFTVMNKSRILRDCEVIRLAVENGPALHVVAIEALEHLGQACDIIDRQSEKLQRITTWSKAYPLDIFPKPDLKKVAVVLKEAGLSLDEVSADNMRHVLEGIMQIFEGE